MALMHFCFLGLTFALFFPDFPIPLPIFKISSDLIISVELSLKFQFEGIFPVSDSHTNF